MKYFLILLVAVATFCCMATNAYAHSSHSSTSNALDFPQFSIPFVVDVHGLWSFGLNFGVHPGATKGIDAALGEMEYPPFPPPGAWMPMFKTDAGNAIVDLRPSTGTTQIDTYRVAFVPDSSMYPITFSWPSLSSHYGGPVRLRYDISGSVFDIDMKVQNSHTMTIGPVNDPNGPPFLWSATEVSIIAEGPLENAALPVVSTFGVGNGGFQAIVHASPGIPTAPNSSLTSINGTSCWFEYGTTRQYGTVTASQLITDGASMNISSPFDPSGMPPNTRMHFRAVAQNSLGTFYGEDRVVSNGNPPPETSTDTTKYRTATYRNWADAIDQKGKRKPVRCRPDKVDFCFTLNIPPPSGNSHEPFTRFTLGFNMPVQELMLFRQTLHTDTLTCPPTTNSSRSVWIFDLNDCLPLPDSIEFVGRGLRGKKMTVSYTWYTATSQNKNGMGGSLPTKPRPQLNDRIIYNDPKLPMPNLHNVGEGIYGGVMQTPFNITIGSSTDPRGAHTVIHPKYTDVLKSLIKEQGGIAVSYHTSSGRCMDKFDGSQRPITKVQKSLPPVKHNNRLFAEQLTLRLNIAASDAGLFPQGFGDLFFDNSEAIATPLDGRTVREIADSVDRFLGCNGPVAGTGNPNEFIRVESLINASFAGPMDTISWSCAKIICTGVQPLGSVPYLRENPDAVPRVALTDWSPQMYTEPKELRLEQNYPNPFNPITAIRFELPVPALVTLKVYDALGQEVAILADHESMDDGVQELAFDASALASGIYFCRITAQSVNEDGERAAGGGYVRTMKMLLIK